MHGLGSTAGAGGTAMLSLFVLQALSGLFATEFFFCFFSHSETQQGEER